MVHTEEEAHFSDPLSAFPPAKEPSTPPRSNSFGSYGSSHNISTGLTGPPSPSVLHPSGSILDPGTQPASSLWPQNEAGRVGLPPVTPSRKYFGSESLPSPTPPLPSPFSPHASSTFLDRLKLRPTTSGRGGSRSGFFTASLDKNKRKDKRSLWIAIREAGVPIYLDTPVFDMFTLCPFALGTCCSITALLKAFSDPEVFYHAYAGGQKLSREDLISHNSDDDRRVTQHAIDVVLAEYGGALLQNNAGQHFTCIHVKKDATSELIIQRSRALVQCFQKNGVAKDKIVVSVPATKNGVHATRFLSKEDGILVNLTMVAGMLHAAVCAEAGAAWVTFNLDGLEKTYRHLGEPSQEIKAIQSTIALFDLHNVETKIMVSAFRDHDMHKILEFPGAHGFSISREQIVSAKLPTSLPCRVPPQSASSLPEDAISQAKDAKWPPRFFDPVGAGGSNGSFIRSFPSGLQKVVLLSQKDLFDHNSAANKKFMLLILEDVVNYKIYLRNLSHPRSGDRNLNRGGNKALARIVNKRRDLRSAEIEWRCTIAGRLGPQVEWIPADVDICTTLVAADGWIEAQIPERWDRREAASMNIEAEDCDDSED